MHVLQRGSANGASCNRTQDRWRERERERDAHSRAPPTCTLLVPHTHHSDEEGGWGAKRREARQGEMRCHYTAGVLHSLQCMHEGVDLRAIHGQPTWCWATGVAARIACGSPRLRSLQPFTRSQSLLHFCTAIFTLLTLATVIFPFPLFPAGSFSFFVPHYHHGH